MGIHAPDREFQHEKLPLDDRFQHRLQPQQGAGAVAQSGEHRQCHLLQQRLYHQNRQADGHALRLYLRRDLQIRRLRQRRRQMGPQSRHSRQRHRPFGRAAGRRALPRHQRRRHGQCRRLYDHRTRPAVAHGRFQQHLRILRLRPERLFPMELRQRHPQRRAHAVRTRQIGGRLQPLERVLRTLDSRKPDK